jgi:hypothetical protein
MATTPQEPKTEMVAEPQIVTETATIQPKKQSTETVETLKAENERLAKELQERNREEATRRKKLEALEKAEQERQEASKSELEKANDRAAKAEADAKSTKLAMLRRDVAAKVGLPAVLADRLKGETVDEIEADATALLETLPKADQKKQSTINPTNPANASHAETKEEQRKRLGMERSVDIYSDQYNTAVGGGLVIPFQE